MSQTRACASQQLRLVNKAQGARTPTHGRPATSGWCQGLPSISITTAQLNLHSKWCSLAGSIDDNPQQQSRVPWHVAAAQHSSPLLHRLFGSSLLLVLLLGAQPNHLRLEVLALDLVHVGGKAAWNRQTDRQADRQRQTNRQAGKQRRTDDRRQTKMDR